MEDFLGLGGSAEGNGVNASEDKGGLVFDLTDAKEDSGFELLPKGDYVCVVDELELTESGAGNPMFKAVFNIVEGEFEKRKLYDYWVLAGNGAEFGLGKLKKFLTRITPEVNIASFDAQGFSDSGSAIGRELTVSVGVQKQTKGEYKGELRNTVRDFTASTAGSFM